MRRTLPLGSLFLAVIAPVIALSTAGFGYAAYVRLYAAILEGFDRKLAALSSATSVYIDPDELVALLAEKKAILARGQDPEQHPTYLKHVLPMRQLRERAGLTFLYTQVLNPGEGRQCIYLVDGTVGEGHSEFGAMDTVPDEDWNIALRVLHDGALEQTAIRRWEQWGLLKCGWAPMYGKDGVIKAMAGADVEITVIRKKTYVALLETLGVGVLTLALAGAVSVRVARKLTRPLGEVREASLRIASGNYGLRCTVDRPREMRALAQALNGLAEMMQTTIEQARPRMEAWRRHRALQGLHDALALPPHTSGELAIAVRPGTEASGYAVVSGDALIWLGRTEEDELAACQSARNIEHLARRLMERDGPAGADRLLALASARLTSAAVFDRRDWSVRVHGVGLVAMVIGGAHAVGDDAVVRIEAGGTVLVVPADLRDAAAGVMSPDAASALDGFRAVGGSAAGVAAAIHRPRQGQGAPA